MPVKRLAIWGCVCAVCGALGLGVWSHLKASAQAAAQGPSTATSPATTPHKLSLLDAPARDMLSFVSANCLECHNAEDHAGDLILEHYKDALSIRKDRKTWTKLLRMVEGGSMPPPELPKKPAKQAVDSFVAASKKVLDYFDPSRPDPGRTTVRRLNRNEYDNSVYDLTGVKFYPSKEFPPDDISGGYDNNADGLTISPLLTERYFLASDAIMQQVLPENGLYPQVSRMDRWPVAPGTYQQKGLGRDLIRHLLPGIKIASQQTAKTEGDYIFKTIAFRRKGANLDVPIMEQLIDGIVINSVAVEATNFENAVLYESPPVHLKAGTHTLEVRWPLKEGQTTPTLQDIGAAAASGGEEPPGLFHRWSEFYGPRTVKSALLAHQPEATPRDAAKEVITRLASRAFRRPATEDEVARLLAFYDAAPDVDKVDATYNDPATKSALAWYQAVRPAVQAIMVSPQFLFRIEQDPEPTAPGPHAITDYQLASRMSYFLWSSPPDEELLALAAKNELHLHLEEQVRRMLKDERADALTANFASQWLHLRMLDKITPDKTLFPEYYQLYQAGAVGREGPQFTLRDFMRTETLSFFNEVQRKDQSILDLIDGKYTYLNGPLAEHYGIVDTKGNLKGQTDPISGGTPIQGPDFVRVELQGPRAGLLTQASLLTLTSNPGRTSPVKRGKFVLEQFLASPPPPPPPNVPALEATHMVKGTLRQQMEQHRANPACASCHLEMDAIGFSFENFNAIGRFRDKDDGAPIDASGTLPGGTTFNGPAGLEKILKDRAATFSSAFAQQMMTYALGRQTQYFDQPAVDKITKAVAGDDYKFSRLVVEIVKSDPFLLRRGKDQTDD